jgi:hypothetical protein
MLPHLAYYGASSPDYFSVGLVCGIIILIAIFLLLLIRRLNARTPGPSTKTVAPSNLEAYTKAYKMRSGVEKRVNEPKLRRAGVEAPAVSPVSPDKGSATAPANRITTQTSAPPDISRGKEETMNNKAPEKDDKKDAPVQPAAGRLSVEAKANQTAPASQNAVAPVVEPVKLETLPVKPVPEPSPAVTEASGASEKPPSTLDPKDAGGQNSAFDIFTDVAIQQSETSKFAAKLEDVSISDLNNQARDVFEAFKKRKQAG